MPRVEPTLLAAHIRRLSGPEALTDGELVGRFVEHRDAAAFEVLVWRHGPMVWATCRRILRHQHDIEDAFQATFLALARTARSIGTRQAVAGWLHRVAMNASLKLKAECRTTGLATEVPARPETEGELAQIVDEELARLPERLRAAFVLCGVEGLTSAEAARELNCPVGTVDSRLHAARTRLRARLSRRGFGPGALAVLVLVAAPPPASVALAVSTSAGTSPRPAVEALADQVARTITSGAMTMKTVAVGVLAVAFAGAVWAFGGSGDVPAPAPAPEAPVPPAPVPAAPDEGRIVLWRDGHSVAVVPGTKGATPLGSGFENRSGFLRLGPNGKQLIYIGNRLTIRPTDPNQHDRVYVRDGTETKQVPLSGLSPCHAFWGADGKVYGHALVPARKRGKDDPDPPVDPTSEFVNWSFDSPAGKITPLKLPGNVSVLDLAPDGKAFLVLQYEKPPKPKEVPMRFDPRVEVEHRLALLPTDGSPPVTLTKFGEQARADFRLSPDGRSALGTMYRTEGGQLFPELVVFHLNAGTRSSVAVSKDARVSASCWSPDGKRIAYVWEPKAAFKEREEAEGPVRPGQKQKLALTLTVAKPDGSEAKDVYTETEYLVGPIDWRGATVPLPVAPAGATTEVRLPRQPGGVLGDRLGEYMTIEGVRLEGAKIETNTLLVDTVNGKKLDKPVPIVVRVCDFNATRFDLETNYPMPFKVRCVFKGFESGGMIGVPQGVYDAAKELGRTEVPMSPVEWQWRPYFIALIPVKAEPKK